MLNTETAVGWPFFSGKASFDWKTAEWETWKFQKRTWPQSIISQFFFHILRKNVVGRPSQQELIPMVSTGLSWLSSKCTFTSINFRWRSVVCYPSHVKIKWHEYQPFYAFAALLLDQDRNPGYWRWDDIGVEKIRSGMHQCLSKSSNSVPFLSKWVSPSHRAHGEA